MNVCPNCNHKELTGTIFCSECGAQLIAGSRNETSPAGVPIDEKPTTPMSATPFGGNSWISLQLVETGELLPLNEANEFTMGRASENQPIMPDVDLTSCKAYENGVSRLHAVIRRSKDNRVSIMDLGSSNGTYVNGIRISPNIHQVIRNGDVVSVGKLKFQVILIK